jgi:putative FmdB family regulatory protein
MPEYEYRCANCKHEFSLGLSIAEHDRKARDREIRCPKCDSADVKQVFGSVFVTTSKKS